MTTLDMVEYSYCMMSLLWLQSCYKGSTDPGFLGPQAEVQTGRPKNLLASAARNKRFGYAEVDAPGK